VTWCSAGSTGATGPSGTVGDPGFTGATGNAVDWWSRSKHNVSSLTLQCCYFIVIIRHQRSVLSGPDRALGPVYVFVCVKF